MVDCSVEWWVGWFTRWLVDWLVGWLIVRLTDRLIDWLVGWYIWYWFVNSWRDWWRDWFDFSMINDEQFFMWLRPIDISIDWLFTSLVHGLKNHWWMGGFMVWFIDLIDWLIDWLPDWFDPVICKWWMMKESWFYETFMWFCG